MEKVYSPQELEPFTYHPLEDGTALVCLRDNIEEVESEDGAVWGAYEVQTVTELPFEEVADNFDQLWVKGEMESKSLVQRVSEQEELLDALMAVVLGEEE